jgi:hypothetical protein
MVRRFESIAGTAARRNLEESASRWAFLTQVQSLAQDAANLELKTAFQWFFLNSWRNWENPDDENERNESTASVNINASYIEALLGKKLIRCKIYFLCTFFIYRPSYVDVFQEICFSYFLNVFSWTLSTPMIIDKDEIYFFYIFILLCT